MTATQVFAAARLAPALAIAAAGISVAPRHLVARTRARPIARQRFALMLALRRRTDWTHSRIAKHLGLGDHTTIVYGVAKAKRLEADVPEFAALVASLEAALAPAESPPE